MILNKWKAYTDEDAFIFAETDGVPHNAITPIARKNSEGRFELDLVLRNNITTEEHPMGVYHPHAEYHHIKKENIGLIEVMGLAVLPARLKNEMVLMEDAILVFARKIVQMTLRIPTAPMMKNPGTKKGYTLFVPRSDSARRMMYPPTAENTPM